MNKYTIWVRMSGDTAVPVHYEMKGFNSLMGSHYDHYFLSYQNFSPEKPADQGFSFFVYSLLCCCCAVNLLSFI